MFAMRHIWLHVFVLVIIWFSELIGIQKISIGNCAVIFLPMLYAFALGNIGGFKLELRLVSDHNF